MGYGTVQYFNKEIDDDDEFSANVNKIPTAALPTQLQPDFLHGLHTAHHFLLVFPSSSFSSRCMCRTKFEPYIDHME